MLEHFRANLESHPGYKSKNSNITISIIDVDADDALIALYDELVPVLTAKKHAGQEVQICHYFLDVNKLKEFLDE